jgi:hypothetical protein
MAQITQQQVDDARAKLGITRDVPDSDIKLLLSTKKGQDEIAKVEKIPSGQGGPGVLGQGHDVVQGISDWLTGHVYDPIGHAITHPSLTTGFEPMPQAPPAPKKEAKAKPLPSPQAAATSAPESPFQQLAQSLASEYLGQVQQLMPLTSGSALFGPQGQTTGLANSAAGAIGGSAGSWLQGLAGQEQKDAATSQAPGVPSLQGAMNQVGEAQAQGSIPMAGAIANTGTANTQYLEAAPWQQILSELASETAYKAASTQGASAFGATPQNTPAFLQQIFKNLGLAGTAQGPAGGLTAPGAAAKGGSGSTSTGLSSTPSQTG